MITRKATKEDAEELAVLMLFAMEEIVYAYTGVNDKNNAKAFMLHFTSSTNNQYSWENCLLAEEEGEILGAVNIYNGAELAHLRQPVLDFLSSDYGRDNFPGDETSAGEYYIDTIAVHPEYRGKGIGSKLLSFIIREYAIEKKVILGLLVEESNEAARKLYLKMGFGYAGEKILFGKKMDHLQYKA